MHAFAVIPEREVIAVSVPTVGTVPVTGLDVRGVAEEETISLMRVSLRDVSDHVITIAGVFHLDCRPVIGGLLVVQVVVAPLAVDGGLLEIHAYRRIILHRDDNGSGRSGRSLCRDGGRASPQILNRSCVVGTRRDTGNTGVAAVPRDGVRTRRRRCSQRNGLTEANH